MTKPVMSVSGAHQPLIPERKLAFLEDEDMVDNARRQEMLGWPHSKLIEKLETTEEALKRSREREKDWDKLVNERGDIIHKMDVARTVAQGRRIRMFSSTVIILRNMVSDPSPPYANDAGRIVAAQRAMKAILYIAETELEDREALNGFLTTAKIAWRNILSMAQADIPEVGSLSARMAGIYAEDDFERMDIASMWDHFHRDGESRYAELLNGMSYQPLKGAGWKRLGNFYIEPQTAPTKTNPSGRPDGTSQGKQDGGYADQAAPKAKSNANS